MGKARKTERKARRTLRFCFLDCNSDGWIREKGCGDEEALGVEGLGGGAVDPSLELPLPVLGLESAINGR